MNSQKPYRTDVSDEALLSFAASCLALARDVSEQCRHDLRKVFSALRRLIRSGAPWRVLPNDTPLREAVYQQTQRWIRADCFKRWRTTCGNCYGVYGGRKARPTAMILDSRALQSRPES
ncbi:transposase [Paraburkholderia terrae]|uniref:transposase n=1 Tax=Paraburkholderia terrae TaxID=311230 RepID=UPI003365385C